MYTGTQGKKCFIASSKIFLCTFRKHPTKLLCTLAPNNALGLTEPPTYTRDDDNIVNLPAICE